MEKKNTIYKEIKDKFTQGCILTFKNWTAFRMGLDANPRVLRYYNEDNSDLEINEMLGRLYDELYTIIASGKFKAYSLIDELADCLYEFIDYYFQLDIQDDSDREVAEVLVKLYDSLKQGKVDVLESLGKSNDYWNKKYSIEFPIVRNQKGAFKKEEEEEEEEDEEEEDEEMEDKDKKDKDKNKNKDKDEDENKMNDGPDEEGFVVVKKRRGKKGF